LEMKLICISHYEILKPPTESFFNELYF